ncbi:hypothetical protein MMC12_001531 [Toensbergia leucococca]|nr:hypothetical protein [Toensbergia leucococca]
MEASPSGPSLPKSPIRPTPPYYNDPSPAQTESGMFGCSPPHSMEEDQRRMAQDITQRMQEDNTPIMSFLTSQPTNAELMSTFLPMASSPPCPGLGAALLTPELESPPRPEWATNLNTSMSPWSESHLDMTPMGQVSYSCEPLHPTISTHSSNSDSSQNMGSMTPDTMTPDPRACDCFTVCLQALQSLHFHSSTQQGTLPFDVVLTINREAIEGCSAMLSCTKCLSKSGSSIWTMLLATLIGKVVSLYRSVSYSHTSPLESPIVRAKSQGSVTFGAYRIASEDEKMLEMEILLIELRKVKKILDRYQGKFRIAQAEKDEMSVYGVLASHMAQNLHFLYEFLRVRKSGASQNVRRNIDI